MALWGPIWGHLLPLKPPQDLLFHITAMISVCNKSDHMIRYHGRYHLPSTGTAILARKSSSIISNTRCGSPMAPHCSMTSNNRRNAA